MGRSDSLGKIKNKEGATSVLIIMLLVVLMVFGLTILTTTLANKNLSVKKQVWLSDYFDLESEVAMELARVDHRIQRAKEAVIAIASEVGVSKKLLMKHIQLELSDVELEQDKLSYKFDISESKEGYDKYIEVELLIIIPDENLSDKDYLNTKNYEIISYVETQDLFDYDDIEYGVPYTPGESE